MSGFRVIGVDLGNKRVGVAVCDSNQLLATPYGMIERVNNRPVEHQRLAEVVEETGAKLIVVGLPLSLDGSLGAAAKAVLAEVKSMRKNIGVEVDTHDERLTTVEAERSQRHMKLGKKKKRQTIDQLAATVILQSWLDSSKSNRQDIETP